MGGLNHGNVVRSNTLLPRSEICHQILSALMLDFIEPLISEKFYKEPPYRVVYIENLPVMLSLLEGMETFPQKIMISILILPHS